MKSIPRELRIKYERWKPVVGFEKTNFVSNYGRVYGTRYRKMFKIKTSPKTGYQEVIFSKNYKRQYVLVHRLVLETFVGPCPIGFECRHLDGNRFNNRLDNLKWGTKRQNARDRDKHGKTVRGSKMWIAKLTEECIPKIRTMLREGETGVSIAEKFSVSKYTISLIKLGRIWKHV